MQAAPRQAEDQHRADDLDLRVPRGDNATAAYGFRARLHKAQTVNAAESRSPTALCTSSNPRPETEESLGSPALVLVVDDLLTFAWQALRGSHSAAGGGARHLGPVALVVRALQRIVQYADVLHVCQRARAAW